MKIFLRRYNPKTWKYEQTGEEVDTYDIAKSINPEALAHLLDTYTNSMGVGYADGYNAGKVMTGFHRTIQRSIVVFLIGILVALSEQEWTDARNEGAIALCRKIAALYHSEGAGPYV